MSGVSFDLHKLGWKSFEDLVGCICRDVYGQSFQTFEDGSDGGRDGAMFGTWKPNDIIERSGSFAVQCKHSSQQGKMLPTSVIDGEVQKIRRLSNRGLADFYIFFTNYRLTAGAEAIAISRFRDAGAKEVLVHGRKWIEQTITERPTLRRLVPRLYGLGDLSQIVTHQAFRQARSVLDSIAPDLDRFVPTEAYRKCADLIQTHGFALLLGEPGSGKTMITNLMALSTADQWQLQTLMLSSPSDFDRLWNPDDPGQFIVVDDAFGSNQYEADRVRSWNHLLPKIKAAIQRGARFIFSSRDYIYNQAKDELKRFDLLDDNQVVIRVEALRREEQESILYNHLKCGGQTLEFRRSIKPYLVGLISDVNMILPEIARRFGNPRFTRNFSPSEQSVQSFFKHPAAWLEDLVASIAPAEKAAIALVFIEGGQLAIPIDVKPELRDVVDLMQSNFGAVKAALSTLNGSILQRVAKKDREYWQFRHPTMRDAFAGYLARNPELIDIYLRGVSTTRLMSEVTCGVLGIRGAKIVIPPERYTEVLGRLRTASEKTRGSFFDPVISFLRQRCSPEFLLRYYTECDSLNNLPNNINFVNRYSDAIQIMQRMHGAKLLPEEVRVKAVNIIATLSRKTLSLNFLDIGVVELFTEQESNSLYIEIKDTILVDFESILEDLESSWDGESDPKELFSDYKDSIE
jgi:hypothetical protein